MIHLENITKSFANGSEQMLALKGVSLHIEAGEFIAIVGQSGSGKSTLMNIIGCLDTLTSGSYKLDGKDITHFSPDELSELRLKKFGFIFQRYNLISANNALENVALPAIYAGSYKDERTARALELLDMLGLKGKEYQNPNKLSGGQQQRVSIARALMNGGEILLCDEPTGALDSASGEMVLKILKELNAKGHTIIMVTHDKGIASHANRIIEIKDGQIICDEKKDAKLAKLEPPKLTYSNNLSALKAELSESLAMSIGAIKAHKLRSFLTMLGIIIGITSVICVVALAKGSQESIIESINKMGTNTIQINPGRGPGDRNSAKVKRFNVDDAKMLEKLELIEVDEEDTSRLRLKFPPSPRSGAYPVQMSDVAMAFDGKQIFSGVNLTVERGDKIAFVGRNGEGKSTLVKCIMGQLHNQGKLELGHNVQIGYFAQNQASLLDGEFTVFQTIDEVAKGEIRNKIRDLLGAFMFGGEDSTKKVKVLSGGERTRLAILKLLLEPVNLLILDEPTNHLDLKTKDVLKQALQDFDGTLIVVSHDRDFLDGLVTKVYEFGHGRVREHLCGIYEFLESKKMESLQELEKKH